MPDLNAILPYAMTFKPEGEGHRNLRKEWLLHLTANSRKVLRPLHVALCFNPKGKMGANREKCGWHSYTPGKIIEKLA